MKLNLLPAYIRQAKRNRTTFFMMLALVFVTLLGFGYWTMSVRNDLAKAKQWDTDNTPTADGVVALAKSADKIYEENAILFRNVELKWYIEKHNLKYPELYRKVTRRLPSYIRLLTLNAGGIDNSKGAKPVWPGLKGGNAAGQAQPVVQGGRPPGGPSPGGGVTDQATAPASGDSMVTIKMQAVLGNYAQYSDVMIALVRKLNKTDDFVVSVARSGFRQNAGNAESAGVQPETGQGAAATFSTVEITAIVKANLVPPNPIVALAAAAKGGGGGAAAAGFGDAGAGGPAPGGPPGGPPGMGGPGGRKSPAGAGASEEGGGGGLGKIKSRGTGGD